MPAADGDAFVIKEVTQHAGASERAFQMQFVDPVWRDNLDERFAASGMAIFAVAAE